MNNDQINKAIIDLKESLNKEKLIAEYNQLAQKISESSELNELEDKLKDLQQQLVDALNKSLTDLHQQLLLQYEELKKAYQEHPLYVNYSNYKEEVNNLLQEVSRILNDL